MDLTKKITEMKHACIILLPIFILITLGCSSNTDKESVKQAIEKISEEWDLNAESGNLVANADFYTEDGVRIGMGMLLKGPDEIRNAFQSFSESGKIIQNDNKVESIWISGDLAVVQGSFSGTFITNSEDGYRSTVEEAGTSIYERQNDGTWKMVLTVFADLTEKNKHVSEMYHELNPDNMDDILSNDFIGQNEHSRFTWNKEGHKNYWSTNRGLATDKIYHQIAESNWVATWFVRTFEQNGETISVEMMQFKRFEDGKIAEIWEYGDPSQWESE